MSIRLLLSKGFVREEIKTCSKIELLQMLVDPDEKYEDIIWFNYLLQVSDISDIILICEEQRLFPKKVQLTAGKIAKSLSRHPGFFSSPTERFFCLISLSVFLPEILETVKAQLSPTHNKLKGKI